MGAGASKPAGLIGGVLFRVMSKGWQPWQSPKGEINMACAGARKGHATPPAYAMQCRQQFYP